MSELLKNASLTPARKLPATPTSVVQMTAPAPSPTRQKEQLAMAFAMELEELREEARSHGYMEGYESGKADASAHFAKKQQELEQAYAAKTAELGDALERLKQLLERMDAGYQQAIADIEPVAVNLAFAGLTKLIGHSDSFQTFLPALVSNAVEQFGHEQALRISISSADAELLRASPALVQWHERLVIDKQLPNASCVVEAGPRSLDASLMLQLEALRKCLLATCESRNHVGD